MTRTARHVPFTLMMEWVAVESEGQVTLHQRGVALATARWNGHVLTHVRHKGPPIPGLPQAAAVALRRACGHRRHVYQGAPLSTPPPPFQPFLASCDDPRRIRTATQRRDPCNP